MGDPILIDCEGTCCPPAARLGSDDAGTEVGMCAMCGGQVVVVEGVVVAHQRDDILARLARGDFDG